MTNDDDAPSTASFGLGYSTFLQHLSFVPFHSFFRFSKSLKRLGAKPWLRATALALRISTQELRVQPCAESAYSHALLSWRFQCTSEIPSWRLRHRLRRNWLLRLLPLRLVDL